MFLLPQHQGWNASTHITYSNPSQDWEQNNFKMKRNQQKDMKIIQIEVARHLRLRDWADQLSGAGSYSWAALSSIWLLKTRYTISFCGGNFTIILKDLRIDLTHQPETFAVSTYQTQYSSKFSPAGHPNSALNIPKCSNPHWMPQRFCEQNQWHRHCSRRTVALKEAPPPK